MGDETDGMDRISGLPLFIIHHIMSYLSTKDVAKTSLLSKRWSYFRTSFPILDFDQSDYLGEVWAEPDFAREKFYELTSKFVEYVNTALHRFCKLNLRMRKFRIYIDPDHVKDFSLLLDRWIPKAVEHGVEDLNIYVKTMRDGRYSLPQSIFNAKSITTLKLGGCKLEHPSSSFIRFCFLKSLTLVMVHVNEQMVQNFTEECSLLEELSFFCCWGIKSFCISKALKLKILQIKQSLGVDHLESIKIAVPSLQQFMLHLVGQQIEPYVIDLSGCQLLKILRLVGNIFKDQELVNFISKFPLLERLFVESSDWLEKIKISSNRLKVLCIDSCINLKAIDVDAPNLLSFIYMFNPVPIFSINALCPWRVACYYEEADADWNLKIKEFLKASDQILNLLISDSSSRTTFNLEDFQNLPSLPPCRVETLTLITCAMVSRYAALLDGIFWICYPKFLCVEVVGENRNKFIKWLYWELRSKNIDCCNSLHIKCWPHYLKDFLVKSSLMNEDLEPGYIDNLPELCVCPREAFQFCLEWSFP